MGTDLPINCSVAAISPVLLLRRSGRILPARSPSDVPRRTEMTVQFRNEVAGLRAIAVIGVVLFHLKVAGVQGVFVGVAVFFVISGSLITRNILRDVHADRSSFAASYRPIPLHTLPPL